MPTAPPTPGSPPRPRERTGLVATVLADARATAAFRGERHQFRSPLDGLGQVIRLVSVSDGFGGQVCFRIAAALRARRVPLLPAIFRRLAIASAAIYVDERAVVHPGLYVVHGQVVVAGRVVIHPGVAISPAVTLAASGEERLVIGPGVNLGTGSRVLGPVRVGAKARVGAGAVVLDDVPEGATVVGIPARAAVA